MAKVKVLSIFHDLETNALRQAGDIFECSDARADVLNNKKLVEVLEKSAPVKAEKDKADKPVFKKK
jgi:hypothetical protein